MLPGYLRRVTRSSDTMITPFFTLATTRNKSTSLTMVGPIVPIYYRSTDIDIGYSATGIFPFFYNSSSPTGRTFATPLFARSESYNVSRTNWFFPTIVTSTDTKGWEVDIHPIVYLGRSERSTHTVLAPILWDFASPEGPHDGRLPALLALRGHRGRLGHAGRAEHALPAEARPGRPRLAVPPAPDLLVRAEPDAAAGRTSSSVFSATTTTARPRRSRRSGCRSRSPAAARPQCRAPRPPRLRRGDARRRAPPPTPHPALTSALASRERDQRGGCAR